MSGHRPGVYRLSSGPRFRRPAPGSVTVRQRPGLIATCAPCATVPSRPVAGRRCEPRGTARDDVEEPRPRPHPQRRARRPRRRAARRRWRSRCCFEPARSRGSAGWTTGRRTSTTSPRSRSGTSSLSLAVGTFEHGEHEITLVDTPGYPDFVGRDDRGLPRRRRRAVRDGRVGRRRGRASRPRSRPRPGDEHRGLLRAQQVRPRERGPGRRARRAAGGVRQQDRAAPPRDRRRRHVQRLRRPRPPQGLPVRGRQGGRDPGPGRARGRGRAAPGPAARGRGRGGRRRVREVPRRGGDLGRRARRVPPQGRPRVDPRARARRVGGQGHRPRRAPRRDRPLPPVARGGGPVRGDRQGAARTSGRGRRAASCSCACSRPRRTRSSAG